MEGRLTGYLFEDGRLLQRALTHKSANAKNNNERLEFLGDAILGAVAADWLFENKPEANEGELTKERAKRVRGSSLAVLGKWLGLEDKLIHEAPAASTEKLLEQAVEAVVGAIFLEAGFEKTRAVVRGWLEGCAGGPASFNPKGELQELLQPKISTEQIAYKLESQSGPDHKKRFCVGLYIKGKLFAKAEGSTKKAAEEAAAEAAVKTVKASKK